jgi:hypothetical protein
MARCTCGAAEREDAARPTVGPPAASLEGTTMPSSRSTALRAVIGTAACLALGAAVALGGSTAANAELPNPTMAAPRDGAIMLSVTNPKVHAVMVYPIDPGPVDEMCTPIHYGWNSISLNGQTAELAIGSSCQRQDKLRTFPRKLVHSREWWDANPRDYLRRTG